jgi:hypothetical protein
MKRNTTRAALVTIATMIGVINGSPLVVPVIGISAATLYLLVDYGAREVERALDAASAERIAQLTWQLRTKAAVASLADQRDRWLTQHPHTPRPAWPTQDPDDFIDQLERALVPMTVPVPPEPEPVIFRGPRVDQVLFADGSLLCIPAELRLYRYADQP